MVLLRAEGGEAPSRRWPVIDDVALGPANRIKNASRLATALPSSPCLRSLRPILAEHDPDHDHRAGCDHHRADHRQLFEDSDNGCPPPMVSREAPACHTHSETPFGPSSNAKQLASNLPIRVPPATTPAPVPWLLSYSGRNIGDLKQKFCA